MHQFYILCFSLIWVISFNTCGTKSKLGTSKSDFVVFLDSTDASTAIIHKDVEKYFESVRPIDMSIQMKKPDPGNTNEVNLQLFKKFISTEVSDWNEGEKKIMTKTMAEVRRLLKNMNPAIMPDIQLVKIKTNHYGKDVYYTRGNLICISENIFDGYNEEIQLPIMIHEVFHILSKNHPALRDTLYSLIGFEKLSSEPLLPKVLLDKLLTNPDGVTKQYVISLPDPNNTNQTIWALPLITSRKSSWEASVPSFFEYLEFDLYPVVKLGNSLVVGVDVLGKTTLPVTATPVFFTKIKDNTRYIIHPEEIIADNFMLAVLAKDKKDYKKFSTEGKKLIESLTTIVERYPF